MNTARFPLSLKEWEPWLDPSFDAPRHLMVVVFDLLRQGCGSGAAGGPFAVNAYTHDVELDCRMLAGVRVRVIQSPPPSAEQESHTAWQAYHHLDQKCRWTVLRWLTGTADPEEVSLLPEAQEGILRRMVGERACDAYLVSHAVQDPAKETDSKPRPRL